MPPCQRDGNRENGTRTHTHTHNIGGIEMSEKKGTAYERTRDAIIMSLYLDHEDSAFTRDAFERSMERAGYGDERTVRKYWKKFVTMGYVRQINASSARLSQEIIENEGRVRPLDAEAELVAEVATPKRTVRRGMV